MVNFEDKSQGGRWNTLSWLVQKLAHPDRDLIQTLLFEYEERAIWTQVVQGFYSLG